jgi:Mg-chelatase subunit ChlD
MLLLHLTLLELPAPLFDLVCLSDTIESVIAEATQYSSRWHGLLRWMLTVEESQRPSFETVRNQWETFPMHADDEILTVNSNRVFPEALVLTAECALPQVRVSPREGEEVPCVVSVKAGGFEERNRPYGVDIVCVVDQSGSMMDVDTLEWVKDALSNLVGRLKPYDRFSLVGFSDRATRKCHLTSCLPKIKPKLSKIIQQLKALDLTNLSDGFLTALDILQQRRHPNQYACIWLFTDGVNNQEGGMETCISALQRYGLRSLIVNCFGYGDKVDFDQLERLAKAGRGTFYHIGCLDHIKKAFTHALQGLTTIVASDLVLKLDLSQVTTSCAITKAYESDTLDEFHIPFITVNQQKDLIFLLQPLKQSFTYQSRISTVQAVLTYTDCGDTGHTLTAPLNITFVKWGSAAVQNADVYAKWYCVLGAESVAQARNRANQGDFEGANEEITRGIETLESGRYPQINPEVQTVLTDLKTARDVLQSQERWEREGNRRLASIVQRINWKLEA